MTTPFTQYTLLFECHADYFECHEVLEEAWQAGNRASLGYAVLIQYAVAHYHARRGNEIGARKSIAALHRKLDFAADELQSLGVDIPQFKRDLTIWPLSTVLPLEPTTRARIERLKHAFEPTALSFEELVHKHLYRDRSPVVKERLRALEARNKAKK
ncbi:MULTISPECIES: DUF309 domain-containing protein [Exiguobacterium]|uniref:DUF309 domain-containing protein n=1 Tax=Exiguobacterium alkaliphilum TaxID=1428684 RepID=A0ABT2KXM6_9BACL|nr:MULTISPECIES: DUF309 domain-containing protein [Exiguobacterium]MCT4794341.1 DUF309 domain-containing protein [Exiguobacterium alkaliphilum]